MARSKRPSLVHQATERIKSYDCRGQSRHKLKQEYREQIEDKGKTVKSTRVPGKITGDQTFKNYLSRSINFVRWVKANYPEVKWLEEIEKRHIEIVNAYIDYLELNKQLSPFTIHGYITGVSMLLRTSNTDYDLPPKSYKDITKNRIDPDAPREGFDHARHQELLKFIKATGLRYVELCRVRPEQVVKDIYGTIKIEIVANQAKGGRPRIVLPIAEDAEWVYEYARARQAAGKDRLFSKRDGELPKYCPYHPARAVFAERKYAEAVISHGTGEIYTRRGDGRKFDKGALQELSSNLGHNRLGICVQNYLWRPVGWDV